VPPRMNVPVLLFTGPVGVGKTTVAAEASGLLSDRGIRHALVDLAHIGLRFPAPADDPWNEQLVHANLASMWSNFERTGAQRLILSRVLETRALLDVLRARILARESGRNPRWYLDAASSLATTMEHERVEDHVVDNVDRPAAEVAAEALGLVGWL
jgi:DNA polymerase III delta prime subunit